MLILLHPPPIQFRLIENRALDGFTGEIFEIGRKRVPLCMLRREPAVNQPNTFIQFRVKGAGHMSPMSAHPIWSH